MTFGYTGGTQLDYTDTISAGTEWTYSLAVFTADYPSIYRRALSIDLTASLSEGQWFEIAELNLVRLEDIASFGRATKGRVGKIRGVVDSVFGRLDGYGAYFRNLYASGDVHIAGTLTAADERGFASTFYVGRIHRNCMLNSLRPNFSYPQKVEWILSGSPTGLGDTCRLPSGTAILELQSEEWSKAHDGQWYCFSFWARTGSPHKLTVGHGRPASVSVALTAQWQRFYYTFRGQRTGIENGDHLHQRSCFRSRGAPTGAGHATHALPAYGRSAARDGRVRRMVRARRYRRHDPASAAAAR